MPSYFIGLNNITIYKRAVKRRQWLNIRITLCTKTLYYLKFCRMYRVNIIFHKKKNIYISIKYAQKYVYI